ncbi:MAG: class I SAM-dependent methyltransferase [Acidobacteriota bacterium]|nr:class I SAM-dependent methyltransferase [Acidobacteriota bacterium]
MSLTRNWRVKGIVQGILSLIPGGVNANDLLQKRLGGLAQFDRNIKAKVDDWSLMMTYLRAAGARSVEGWKALETGTGWCPVLPVCFILAGARSVCAVDLNRHISEELTLRMIRGLEPHLPDIAAKSGRAHSSVEEHWRRLAAADSLTSLLAAAHIDYRAPQDAGKLDWIADGALNLVFSNSVFEHIPPPVIPRLLRESRRVLAADGLIAHEVACNDHYANFDSGVSFVNYLQYPEWRWRFWNNRIQYQNRLRAPDFTRMARENGFRIVHEARHINPGTREALAGMRVASMFSHYSQDDLASTTVDFVAAKSPESVL